MNGHFASMITRFTSAYFRILAKNAAKDFKTGDIPEEEYEVLH